MATTQNRKKSVKKGANDLSNMDMARWSVGVMTLIVGLFTFISIIFYFFDWKSDYDLVTKSVVSSPDVVAQGVINPCGPLGAWLAEQLIGRSFGLMGIIIPLLMIILSLRIVKLMPLKFNRTALSLSMVLFCGSFSLGFIFGENWGVFNSGLGGLYGIEITNFVEGIIGPIGTVLLILGMWAGTAVFINRNFIKTVNKAGSAALDSGGKIVTNIVKVGALRDKRSRDEAAESEVTPDIEEETISQIEAEIETEAETAESDEEDLSNFDEFVDEELAREGETYTVDDGEGVSVTIESKEMEMVSEEDVEQDLYDPMLDLNSYTPPPVSLLVDYQSKSDVTEVEILDNKSLIEETLKYFGIPIQQIKATIGPTITLYEIVQAQGVKISKIQGLENDIAQSLKAETGIRIIAPIPGRGTIGIEVPNINKQVVSMYSSILSQRFQDLRAELPIVVGRTIQNEPYVFDLAKMPHLLVAGATGQGKSVGLNAIITSLLYRKHPSQLKFVMIDPKMVEFTPYKGLEHHFMAKMESEDDVIITDPKKAVNTLNACCEEMEKRLKLLSDASVRNIVEYNTKFSHRRLNPEKGHFYMPYIVVIVDEFADLIMMSREVETPVMRLAQKARAVGIHLIIATQRPDVKVITGGIKANFPARIAFRVMQMIDSRTIIDQPGANLLIGRGDMLFKKDGELTRVQCSLVETDEVGRIVEHIEQQQGYPQAYLLPDYSPESGDGIDNLGENGPAIKYDLLFADIARAAVSGGGISTSAIQRNYEVGFNRAGRIMTQLERAGIVGRQEGAKPREILFYDMQSLEAKLQSLGLF
ncbi:MAG: DNA translocase FtsK 4TM domain-containing protein [Rikenellaceae bacterium]